MKRTKKMLATVVALAMVLSVGNVKTVSAEAATCPPHGICEDRYVHAEIPVGKFHVIHVMDEWTLECHTETCRYSTQNIKREIVCTRCNVTTSTYWMEIICHNNAECKLCGITRRINR